MGTVHYEIQKSIRNFDRYCTEPFCLIKQHDHFIMLNLDALICGDGSCTFKKVASELCWSFDGRQPSPKLAVQLKQHLRAFITPEELNAQTMLLEQEASHPLEV